MKRLVLLLALAAPACSGTSPTPITPTVVLPACQQNNTADVTLRNSSTSFTMDVLVDNIVKGSVAPSQTLTVTVAAGVQHSVVMRYTNTALNACNSPAASFAQCSTQTLTCSGS
jgi:hypothetical protein